MNLYVHVFIYPVHVYVENTMTFDILKEKLLLNQKLFSTTNKHIQKTYILE